MQVQQNNVQTGDIFSQLAYSHR